MGAGTAGQGHGHLARQYGTGACLSSHSPLHCFKFNPYACLVPNTYLPGEAHGCQEPQGPWEHGGHYGSSNIPEAAHTSCFHLCPSPRSPGPLAHRHASLDTDHLVSETSGRCHLGTPAQACYVEACMLRCAQPSRCSYLLL